MQLYSQRRILRNPEPLIFSVSRAVNMTGKLERAERAHFTLSTCAGKPILPCTVHLKPLRNSKKFSITAESL